MPELDPTWRAALLVVSGASLAGLLLAVAAFPVVLRRLPADWFDRPPAPVGARLRERPGRTLGRLALGGLLVAAGVAMLALPGQGLLTLAVGLLVLDLPHTRRLAGRLARRPAVARALQALRKRGGAPPFAGLPGATAEGDTE